MAKLVVEIAFLFQHPAKLPHGKFEPAFQQADCAEEHFNSLGFGGGPPCCQSTEQQPSGNLVQSFTTRVVSEGVRVHRSCSVRDNTITKAQVSWNSVGGL